MRKLNRPTVLAAFTFGLAFTALGRTPVRGQIDVQFANRLLFWARSLLHQPPLDPRLKIFAFDDRTAARLGDLDLSLSDWDQVIATLGSAKPARILIDKLFDKSYVAADVAQFIAASATWPVKPSPIAFANTAAITFRQELAPNAKTLTWQAMAPAQNSAGAPAWLQRSASHLYGTHPDLIDAFGPIGHAVYDGHGTAPALETSTDRLLPHAGLLVADHLALVGQTLTADGQPVPVDRQGRILLNLAPPRYYEARTLSMLELIGRARSHKSVSDVVQAGDVVVLLPAMFTGNTDWRETPFGSLPGGYLLTAVANSVLTNSWLTPVDQDGKGPLIGAALALSAALLPTAGLIAVAVGAPPLAIGVSLFLFTWHGLAVPWTLPLLALLLTIFVELVLRYRSSELASVRIEGELKTATLVQAAFFPPPDRTTASLTIDSCVSPASECGGDWWGLYPAGPGKECLLVADATGHGVAAALVTAMVFAMANLLDGLAKEGLATFQSPARVLALTNQVLASAAAKTATMTMIVATFDLNQGELLLANGGHVNPFLVPRAADDPRLTNNQRCVKLRSRGSVLGYSAQSRFTEQTERFLAGDRIVFYTDGLTEAPGGPKALPWKENGLRDSIARWATEDLVQMRLGILADLKRHQAGRAADDDVTLVIVEISKAAAPTVAADV